MPDSAAGFVCAFFAVLAVLCLGISLIVFLFSIRGDDHSVWKSLAIFMLAGSAVCAVIAAGARIVAG